MTKKNILNKEYETLRAENKKLRKALEEISFGATPYESGSISARDVYEFATQVLTQCSYTAWLKEREKLRDDLLSIVMEMDLDCRNDEDCDHCLYTVLHQMINDHEKTKP